MMGFGGRHQSISLLFQHSVTSSSLNYQALPFNGSSCLLKKRGQHIHDDPLRPDALHHPPVRVAHRV